VARQAALVAAVLRDHHLRLRPGVVLATTSGGAIALRSEDVMLEITQPGVAVRRAVELLAGCGSTLGGLARVSVDRESSVLHVVALAERLHRLGWLSYSVVGDNGALVSATPLTATAAERDLAPGDGTFVFSRFAYCQAEAGHLVLRSPLSLFEVVFDDPRLAVLLGFGRRPVSPGTLAGLRVPLKREAMASIIQLLAFTGMLTELREDGTTEEDANDAVRQWEFHDLLFHAASRDGRHRHPSGGTYRFRGVLESLPAVRPVIGDELVSLPQPRGRTRWSERTLFAVLDERQSVRVHGDAAIDVEELAEFLYRSARIREVVAIEDEEVCRRPYPSGGALHELETYLVINSCVGLDCGLYHYRAYEHVLSRISPRTPAVEALLEDAGWSLGHDPPQVLVVLAARFQRLSWKYEAIAYATLLKNVGCLLQTMYLVATAMGLAPCALGGGNSEIFSAATGCAPFVESSVAEFALSKPPNGNTREP
jgi:SagB-type dehydrogenase family enzyme